MDETTTIIEISTDGLTLEADKADSAVAFLNEWSAWLAEVIRVIKEFFEKLSASFAE